MMSKARMKELMEHKAWILKTAPQRENFPTDEAFDEARSYWRTHQGRQLPRLDEQIRLLDSPESSSLTKKK